jgi:hypothetical protein
MFEDPVAADEISYCMRFEQNTFYSSGLASESGIDQQFPLFCAFCFAMKLCKPLVGNKQGEKNPTRTSSVLDTLKGNMTFGFRKEMPPQQCILFRCLHHLLDIVYVFLYRSSPH